MGNFCFIGYMYNMHILDSISHQQLYFWVVLYDRNSIILPKEPFQYNQQSLEQLTDEDVVKLCIQHQRVDAHIFSILVTRHEALIYRVALRYLAIDADADDAAQDTFLKAFRGLLGFRQDAKFKTWLFKILHNVCMTRLSQRTRRESIEYEENETYDLPANTTEVDEYQQLIDNDAIQQTLDLLKDQERQVLILKLIAELSLQETADTLGLSLSATKMRFYRAQEHFSEIYTKIQNPTIGERHDD